MAVKIMKPSALEDAKVKFIQEAAILGQFFHSNVVKLYGLVTVSSPVSCLRKLASYVQSARGSLLFAKTYISILARTPYSVLEKNCACMELWPAPRVSSRILVVRGGGGRVGTLGVKLPLCTLPWMKPCTQA